MYVINDIDIRGVGSRIEMTDNSDVKINFAKPHVDTNTYMFVGLVFVQSLIILYLVNDVSIISNYIIVDSTYQALNAIAGSILRYKMTMHSVYQRYLLYMIMSIVYWLISGIFWIHNGTHLRNVFLLVANPQIFAHVSNWHYVQVTTKYINGKVNTMYMHALCCSVAYCINVVFQQLLRRYKNAAMYKVTTKDILEDIACVDVSTSACLDFVKTFVIAVILCYVESFSAVIPFVMPIVSIIAGKYIDINDPLGGHHDKEKLYLMLKHKRFDLVANQCVLKSLVAVWRKSRGGTLLEEIHAYVRLLNKSLGRFCAIWSILSVFDLKGVGAIGSIVLLVTPKSRSTITPQQVICRLLGVVVGIFSNDLYGVAVSEFAEYLDGRLTRTILTTAYTWMYSRLYLLHHCNKYNYCIIVCVVGLSTFDVSMGFGIMMLSLMNFADYHTYIYIAMLVLGALSNYNIIHMILLGIVVYVSVNIIMVDQAEKPKIDMQIIDSYERIDGAVIQVKKSPSETALDEFVKID